MDTVLDLIRSAMGAKAVDQISEQLGQDHDATTNAVRSAMPVLIGALGKRAQSDGGSGLARAIDKDHDGSILTNVEGFLKAGDFRDGAGILGHLFGAKTNQAATAVGKSAGLNAGQASSLMVMLAPIVMGALGKMKKDSNLDAGRLTEVLSGQGKDLDQRTPGLMGAIGGLLDADGDGDTDLADLLAHGRRHLINFF